jgi:probable rRNA maturation factor
MSLYSVDVQVEESYQSRVQSETLRKAAETTLQHEGVEDRCELVVVVSTDETLHALNRRHRGVDAPTDVLAFPQQRNGPAPFVFVSEPSFEVDAVTPRYLGDVIISFPRAEAQAAEAENEIAAELQLLVVHGVLHLLGYDDEIEPELARMWRAQQAVLTELGVEVHLPD